MVQFLASPQAMLSRERLLEALPGGDARRGDRHLDFLVCRLRRLLGDTARRPRYIATQYGEGYRWVATQPEPPPVAEDTFLVILPLHRHLSAPARELLQALGGAMGRRIARVQACAVAPHGWRPRPDARTAYVLDSSAWDEPDTLHLAFVLREALTRRPLHPLRLSLPLSVRAGGLVVHDAVEAVADTLQQHIWAHQALAPDADLGSGPPLELRLHEASRLFGQADVMTWRESLAGIEKLDSRCHEAPTRDIGRALALHIRIVQQSPRTQLLSAAEWDALEEEIEGLVLPHLGAIGGQPRLELAASRLLSGLGGRHAGTAFALARSGFAGTTDFADALPALAQCHVFAGDFTTAHALYERCLDLAEPGSEYQVYLLVLRCIACLGSGDLAALARCRAELFAAKPATRAELGFVLSGPGTEPPAEVAAAFSSLGAAKQRLMALHMERNARTFFRHPGHQSNFLRGYAVHACRLAGAEILPQALRALV